jgi:hypothetical protein
MAKPSELYNQGCRCYEGGKYREACLLFLQASDLAFAMQDQVSWYEYKGWAAVTLVAADEYSKAMVHLLELRLNEPANRSDLMAWTTKTNMVLIALTTRPVRAKLAEFMGELKDFSRIYNTPIADISYLEGQILRERGSLQSALLSSEKAWGSHNGQGIMKHSFALNAAECCLALNHLTQSKEWLLASIETNENTSDKNAVIAILNLKLALVELAPTQLLHKLMREFEDIVLLIQDKSWQDTLSEFNSRVALLTQPAVDPINNSHPAKQSLLQRILEYQNVHTQYERRILLSDFRLAALRYCVSIPPVDDLYYAKPQQLQPPSKDLDIHELKKRLQRALSSCAKAERYGKKIDDMLECDWRQKAVQGRRERINEIAQYYDSES